MPFKTILVFHIITFQPHLCSKQELRKEFPIIISFHFLIFFHFTYISKSLPLKFDTQLIRFFLKLQLHYYVWEIIISLLHSLVWSTPQDTSIWLRWRVHVSRVWFFPKRAWDYIPIKCPLELHDKLEWRKEETEL